MLAKMAVRLWMQAGGPVAGVGARAGVEAGDAMSMTSLQVAVLQIDLVGAVQVQPLSLPGSVTTYVLPWMVPHPAVVLLKLQCCLCWCRMSQPAQAAGV